jgi:hypothetical protein
MCRQLEISAKFFLQMWAQLNRTRRDTSRNFVFNVLQQYFCGRIHQK